MLLVLFYVLAALALGGYTTYLLATALPESLLERTSRHGRFAGLHGDEPPAASDAKADTPGKPVTDKNASRC